MPLWDRAAQGEKMNWDDIFANYQSSCDWPSCSFYEELAAFYPDAKMILTLRDPEAWYKSVSSTIMGSMRKPVEGQEGPPGIFIPLLIGEKTFHNDFSRENMIAVFNRHNEEVKRVIAPERLLVFEAAQGWEPLCRFLGVPVPATPFPRTNTTEEFQQRIAERMQQIAAAQNR